MTLPRIPKAVVFDMDGLLCDTEVVYRDSMFATAAEHGHDMPLSLFKSMIGLPGPMSDRQVLNHFGEDFPIQAFNDRVQEHVDLACGQGSNLAGGPAAHLAGVQRADCRWRQRTCGGHGQGVDLGRRQGCDLRGGQSRHLIGVKPCDLRGAKACDGRQGDPRDILRLKRGNLGGLQASHLGCGQGCGLNSCQGFDIGGRKPGKGGRRQCRDGR